MPTSIPHPDPYIATLDRKNDRIEALQAQVSQLETDKAAYHHALTLARGALWNVVSAVRPPKAFSKAREAMLFIDGIIGAPELPGEAKP